MPKIDLASLAGMVQQYISRKYAAALIDRTKVAELKAYIAQYLYDTGFTVDGYTEKTLADRLYSEMAEYSVLTRYLDDPDIEEVNVNGWDDIAITHLDGRIEKTKEHFFSPQHAEDVVKKLLQHSGMIIDNASPLAQGHLPNNTRITAVKKPVVDEERAIAVSIRKLYPQRVDKDNLIRTNALTEEMLGFLETCIRYGVSFVVAGRTSSGKTILLNALLAGIPDNKRIYTIESGARELSLVKRNGAGEVINNVVHTISRPSDNEAYNITQAQLLMAALRFDPDIICVGEMRDREAYSAIEASSTDHTVVITINSNACLLTADVQKKLIDLGVDQFAASLDGCTALVNDSIRGNGTFEKVVSNIKQLNEQTKRYFSSLETALVFTLTKKNLHELILLPSLAEEIGVNLITLTTFIESGQGQKNHDVFQIDFNTICDAIDLMVSKELTKHRIPLQIDMRPRFCEYLSAAYSVPIIYNLKNSLCCAGEDMWYLEANGNVHPCLIFQLESGKLALRNNVYQKEIININWTVIL